MQDKNVAFKIFDLGLKKFGEFPEYSVAFLDYMAHINGWFVFAFHSFICLLVFLRIFCRTTVTFACIQYIQRIITRVYCLSEFSPRARFPSTNNCTCSTYYFDLTHSLICVCFNQFNWLYLVHFFVKRLYTYVCEWCLFAVEKSGIGLWTLRRTLATCQAFRRLIRDAYNHCQRY